MTGSRSQRLIMTLLLIFITLLFMFYFEKVNMEVFLYF